jgi:single-strand DNA-binding protein
MANTIHVFGNLGDNPTLHVFESGAQVCNFSLADSSKFKNNAGEVVERVTWHRVSVWGKPAENCKKYLTKGRQVYVTGELQQRVVVDDNGKKQVYYQIRAARVDFGQRPKTQQTTEQVVEATEQPSEAEQSEEQVAPSQQEQLAALLDNDVVF